MAPATVAANVAPCEKAVLGHGPPNWRQPAITAGPVGVFKHPLNQMSRTGNGLVENGGTYQLRLGRPQVF